MKPTYHELLAFALRKCGHYVKIKVRRYKAYTYAVFQQIDDKCYTTSNADKAMANNDAMALVIKEMENEKEKETAEEEKEVH